MPIPKQTEKVQHQTAKDIVFSNVLEWIVTGVLTPGEKIIDTDLAAYFPSAGPRSEKPCSRWRSWSWSR